MKNPQILAQHRQAEMAWRLHTYTKTPVAINATKVPKIANVTIAPKFEKKGFWQISAQY